MKKPSASIFSPIPDAKPLPDPTRYEIIVAEQIGRCVLLKVRYPDCDNYEGQKILLYADTTIEALKAQGALDPHFSDNPHKLSPIARFQPTERGMKLAWECTEVLM